MDKDRENLFRTGNDNSPYAPRNTRAFGKPAQEPESTRNLTNDQLLQRQQQTIKEQDDSLDVLAQSISKTKEIAYAIGNEADEQSKLLDDIHGKVDKTKAKVKNTTKRVDRVHQQSSTKVLWCLIILLLLSLIAVSYLAIKT